jgi:hypothetical protein
MNKQRPRFQKQPPRLASPFEAARDELFQHIMRCGVIGSEPADQKEWFDNTLDYLQDRYHELSPTELGDLRTLGERFAQPAKTKKAV